MQDEPEAGVCFRNIGDALLEKNVSWKYYGDQWNAYLANPDANYVALDNQ
jgi:phospholipase C